MQVNFSFSDEPMPPAEGANWFYLSRLNNEFQLLIGYVDMREVANAASGTKNSEITLTPHVAHRLYMGLDSFQVLRAQIEDIAQKTSIPPLSK